MKTVVAFFLGLAAMALVVWPSHEAPAKSDKYYYDMGTIHVQFQTEDCGARTLAVSYQIEFGDEAKTTFITSYKPKLESVLFTDLNEYLLETQNTRVRSVKKVMLRGVESVLGKGLASDILITSTSIIDG